MSPPRSTLSDLLALGLLETAVDADGYPVVRVVFGKEEEDAAWELRGLLEEARQ